MARHVDISTRCDWLPLTFTSEMSSEEVKGAAAVGDVRLHAGEPCASERVSTVHAEDGSRGGLAEPQRVGSRVVVFGEDRLLSLGSGVAELLRRRRTHRARPAARRLTQ